MLELNTPFGSDGSSAGHADFSSTTMNKNNKDQLGTNGWGGANGIQEGGRPVVVRANAATDYIDASAEL